MTPYWDRIKTEFRPIVEGHMASVPVKVGQLARDLGLEVKAATLKPGISGMIARANTPAGFEIKVNRHENSLRQRFTIAHEIAHFLLHSELIGDGVEDSILYRSPKMGDAREAEANRLAAEILMPRAKIIDYLNQLGGTPSPDTAQVLSEAFATSQDAMKIRIGVR